MNEASLTKQNVSDRKGWSEHSPTWWRRAALMTLADVAFHEAGHVIVAWATGRKALRVSMVSDAEFARMRRDPHPDHSAGQVVYGPLPACVRLDLPEYRALAEREALISLAGDLAMLRHRGHSLRKEPSRTDLLLASFAAAQAEASGEGLEACLDRLLARAALLLNHFWPAVEAVATALLRRRHLTGNEVEDLLGAIRR